MMKNGIKVGGYYISKISGKLVTVRVNKIVDRYGYEDLHGLGLSYHITDLSTGRDIIFWSARRFRQEVDPQTAFKQLHNIEDCTCKIIDFDWPNPTVEFNKSCPSHQLPYLKIRRAEC